MYVLLPQSETLFNNGFVEIRYSDGNLREDTYTTPTSHTFVLLVISGTQY